MATELPDCKGIPGAVWSIGHSTRPLVEFLEVLAAHGVQAIADVRRFPGSRRHPQFAREALERSLAEQGLGYLWLPQLGGRRSARKDSPNTAWRNAAFKGYADHLGSAEFAQGFEALCALARERRTAMMCAESLWWQCHRSLISDVLKVCGAQVWHILDSREATLHPYTSAARLVDGRLDYSLPGTGELFG
jgi:uncharacterized protein (DUF488 family)